MTPRNKFRLIKDSGPLYFGTQSARDAAGSRAAAASRATVVIGEKWDAGSWKRDAEFNKKDNAMSEPRLSSTPWRRRPPRSIRTNADDSLVCAHRDTTVCGACLKANREIIDMHGNYYWMANEAQYAEHAAMVAEVDAGKTFLVGDEDVAREARAARGKPLEERTSAERVEVIHDRSNAADRVETMLRRELATFADPLDRAFVLDALERRLAEVRKDMT